MDNKLHEILDTWRTKERIENGEVATGPLPLIGIRDH